MLTKKAMLMFVTWVFVVFGIVYAAEFTYVVYCDQRADSAKQVPVYADVQRSSVSKNLACGAEIAVLSMDKELTKIQVGNEVGYIESRFVGRVERVTDQQPAPAPPVIQPVSSYPTAAPQAAPPSGSVPTVTPRIAGGIVNPANQGTAEPVYERSRFDVAGMFTWVRSFEGGAMDFLGWNVGIGGNFNSYFGLEANVGGNYWLSPVGGVGAHIYGFSGGPRVTFPTQRVTPFVHFLVGMARATGYSFGFSASDNALLLMPGVGMDVKVSQHFAIRAFQADYLVFHSGGAWGYKTMRIGGGVVAKF